MPPAAPLPDLLVPDAAAWGTWLGENAAAHAGVRLVLAKGTTTEPTSLSYEAAVLEALCHGWIDGQASTVDAATYAVRMTPRRPRSMWSRKNVERVAVLVEQGRMRERGAAEVAAAQADGRWDAAYAGAATIQPPRELADALEADPAAAAAFAALPGAERYSWLYRMTTVKRAETSARHVAALLARLREPS